PANAPGCNAARLRQQRARGRLLGRVPAVLLQPEPRVVRGVAALRRLPQSGCRRGDRITDSQAASDESAVARRSSLHPARRSLSARTSAARACRQGDPTMTKPTPNLDRATPGMGGRYFGVYTGAVRDNQDPLGQGRVAVTVASVEGKLAREQVWARVAVAFAGSERGMWMLPDVGDEVLVAFEAGDPGRPIVVGSLWREIGRAAG